MDVQDYAKPRSPYMSSDSSTDHYTKHKEQANSPSPMLQPNNTIRDEDRTLTPVDTYQTYEAHGGTIDNTKAEEQAKIDYEHHKDLWWYRVRYTFREPFAEFCGTMIMIVFGDGSVAQVTLSANERLPMSSQDKGEYQSISWGWGIGVMLGVYVCGCSGGHLNPAVTLGKSTTSFRSLLREACQYMSLTTVTSKLYLPWLPLVEIPHLRRCPNPWLLLRRRHYLRKLRIRNRRIRRLWRTHSAGIQRSRHSRNL